MIPDADYIREKFDSFNELCFEGRLVRPEIEIMRSRHCLGQVCYRRERRPGKGWIFSGLRLRISGSVDLEESVAEDILLHEMIHCHILSNQLHDSSAHGVIFRSMMRKINTGFGRHIRISHKRSEEELRSDTRVREHFVCVCRLRNGEDCITVSARTSVFRIMDAVSSLDLISGADWYYSKDPYFNRYPRSRTLKLYRISDREGLRVALENSGPLHLREQQYRKA